MPRQVTRYLVPDELIERVLTDPVPPTIMIDNVSVPVTDLAIPCVTGEHGHCSGRIMLRRPAGGRRYRRCVCPAPQCRHPEPSQD